ncbi:MAG: MarR family winged helix-turn-helix transcriptional regulator, partial [Burkholderiales bacterium]
SDATNVTENTTATLINGMIKAGLVTRERDPDDGRKLCIRLTPKGRQWEGQLMGYAIEINKVAIKGIAPQEAEICASVLRRISTNLQTEFDKVAAR